MHLLAFKLPQDAFMHPEQNLNNKYLLVFILKLMYNQISIILDFIRTKSFSMGFDHAVTISTEFVPNISAYINGIVTQETTINW